MATLYLDRKGIELKQQGKALLVYMSGEKRDSVPMSHIDRVVLRGGILTNTSTLGALLDEGIAVTLTTGRFGRRQGTLLGPLHKDARRRLAQYQAHVDDSTRTGIAQSIVRHKLLAHRRLLRRALKERPDRRYQLTRALEQLNYQTSVLQSTKCSLPRLRGIEGASAAAYFAGYRALFPKSLGFEARRRRPPPDPVNAALSLGYTLLHAEAVQACHQAGLDPYLGFLHDLDYGRESLASDLIEPLRTRIDDMVWRLFRLRELTASHFSSAEDACLLDKSGRAIYYGAFEAAMPACRRWMRRALYQSIRHLMS